MSFPMRNLYAASFRQCPDLSWAISAASFLLGISLSLSTLWSLYVALTRGYVGAWSLMCLLMAALAALKLMGITWPSIVVASLAY